MHAGAICERVPVDGESPAPARGAVFRLVLLPWRDSAFPRHQPGQGICDGLTLGSLPYLPLLRHWTKRKVFHSLY